MDSGAINKQTLQYVLPDKATKSHEYICPDCNKKLILCKGKIRKAHFRHKVDKKDPCQYYTNPTETQIHKDAKLRLKELIKTKNLKLNRYCHNCKKTKQHSMPEICEKSKICIEHKFEYNESNKFADVAFLKDGNIEQIYEICQTHKTKEKDRPEPWFEFNAEDIIELSKKEDNDLQLNCIRDNNCDECMYMASLKNNDLEKWIRIKLGQDYVNPKYTKWDRNITINEEEYNKLDDKRKSEFKPNHQRIDMSAHNCNCDSCRNCGGGCGIKSCNDDLYDINKKICDIFLDDLNTNRIVLYSWKGQITGYIVKNEDFDRYDYWNNNYWCDGINSNLDLPYLYTYSYCGYGTVDILKDLIVNSLKFTPNNECKYVNSESEYSDDDCESEYSDDDCLACNNTGTSYWSDGIYGPCMLCHRGKSF